MPKFLAVADRAVTRTIIFNRALRRVGATEGGSIQFNGPPFFPEVKQPELKFSPAQAFRRDTTKKANEMLPNVGTIAWLSCGQLQKLGPQPPNAGSHPSLAL